MLHLLSGFKAVGPGSAFGGAQVCLTHQPGQGAVGQIDMVVVLKALLDTHDIAATPFKGGLDEGQDLLVWRAYRLSGCVWLAQDAAHGVARDLKQTADLTQGGVFAVQGQDRLSGFVRDHGRHTS